MEFQEAMVRYMIHKPMHNEKSLEPERKVPADTSSPKHKWRISFYRSSSSSLPSKPLKLNLPPNEFLCPISGSLMAEPVIVSSGQSFEKTCVQACKSLDFFPILADNCKPNFSTVIPNLALKSTILKWCKVSSIDPPNRLDYSSAEKLVHTLMATQNHKPNIKKLEEVLDFDEELIRRVEENPPVNFTHAATEVTRRSTHFQSSSDEIAGSTELTPPLQLTTRPSCYSSTSSSTEIEIPSSEEEEGIVNNLRSQLVFEIEEAVISLRNITKTREESRIQLCTPRLLSAVRSLIISRYSNIQVNSVAALVNLSLEKTNKVKIVRSGIVPPLINVLKGGFPEAQEHASGALFSLALEDENKTAIGVLGALPPLLHMLRSESERTRNDSALALYHLSLVQSNRTKLVKMGAVSVLLAMVKSGQIADRVMLILCNLSACVDGRTALLDSGGVECMVGMLQGNELNSEATRESCVGVLYGLSYGGLRFKGLAKAVNAAEVWRKVEKTGSERAKEKARKMIEIIKGMNVEDEDESVDWEELLESGLGNRNRCRLGGGVGGSNGVNSSEF